MDKRTRTQIAQLWISTNLSEWSTWKTCPPTALTLPLLCPLIQTLLPNSFAWTMLYPWFLEQFKTLDSFEDLMTTIFERQDFIIKMNEMQHLAGLVKQLQNEVSALREYMQELFNTMEAAGIHQLLKKQYIWWGVIGQQQELHFNFDTIDRPSTLQRPSTPYPCCKSSWQQLLRLQVLFQLAAKSATGTFLLRKP